MKVVYGKVTLEDSSSDCLNNEGLLIKLESSQYQLKGLNDLYNTHHNDPLHREFFLKRFSVELDQAHYCF